MSTCVTSQLLCSFLFRWDDHNRKGRSGTTFEVLQIKGLVEDCSISSEYAMVILRSYSKSSTGSALVFCAREGDEFSVQTSPSCGIICNTPCVCFVYLFHCTINKHYKIYTFHWGPPHLKPTYYTPEMLVLLTSDTECKLVYHDLVFLSWSFIWQMSVSYNQIGWRNTQLIEGVLSQ